MDNIQIDYDNTGSGTVNWWESQYSGVTQQARVLNHVTPLLTFNRTGVVELDGRFVDFIHRSYQTRLAAVHTAMPFREQAHMMRQLLAESVQQFCNYVVSNDPELSSLSVTISMMHTDEPTPRDRVCVFNNNNVPRWSIWSAVNPVRSFYLHSQERQYRTGGIVHTNSVFGMMLDSQDRVVGLHLMSDLDHPAQTWHCLPSTRSLESLEQLSPGLAPIYVIYATLRTLYALWEPFNE